MSHTFTKDQRQRGGWVRARQHASYRRENPTRLEEKTRDILLKAGWIVQPEYEIMTSFPQWIDILAEKNGRKIAIEVDGSHGWHSNGNFYQVGNLKMSKYDEAKARWCQEQGIPLLYVNSHTNVLEMINE